MNLLKIIISISCIMVTGCDPECLVKTFVVNRTNDTLYVSVNNSFYSGARGDSTDKTRSKTVVINPDSVVLFWRDYRIGTPGYMTFKNYYPAKDSLKVSYKGRSFLLNMKDTTLYARKVSYKHPAFNSEVNFYRVVRSGEFKQ